MMRIDYGRVERYVEDRGFGFISHTFVDSSPKEVFFHIKTLRRARPELAQSLDGENSGDSLYFWYEFGASEKGQQVVAVLDIATIRRKYADELLVFADMVRARWMRLGSPLSESVRKATLELLARDEASQLEKRRTELEIAQEENDRAVRAAEIARLQEIEFLEAAEKRAREDEFRRLVAEMSLLGFSRSSQVSAHIRRHRLGDRYRHISGVLEMIGGDGTIWDFDGGFPPEIYARLCQELGLESQGSRARPGSFTPYKDIFKK